MGAFNRVSEITIPRTPEEGKAWGWDQHETVTLKDVYTIGDAEYTAVFREGAPSVSPVKLLDAMIVRWHLTDENGNEAVKNERSIARLPANYAQPITDEIGKIIEKGQVKDPNAFLNSASAPTSAS